MKVRGEEHPGCKPNCCIVNVETKVAESGGRVVFGWRYRRRNDLYTVIAHHAVWQKPDGTLVDITPVLILSDFGNTMPSLMPEIEFEPDPTALPIGEKPNRRTLPHKYIPASADARLHLGCEYLARSEDAFFQGNVSCGNYWASKAEKAFQRYKRGVKVISPGLFKPF